MSYFIPFSNVLKTPIEVQDKVINTSTSLGIAGYKAISYGEVIAKNFIHLLENFACDNPPDNPIEGQLWYKTVNNDKQLNIYNGAEWVPSSGVWKSSVAPSNPETGNMWIDTINKKLFIYASNMWICVGSSDGSTDETGVVTDQIIDTTNSTHDVLRYKINGKTVAIISKFSFIPKSFEAGFLNIDAGININSVKHNGLSSYNINGIVSNAKNLIIQHSASEEIIPANTLVRSDTESLLNYKLVINNNDGLIIGGHSNVSISVKNNHVFIENSIQGSHINFSLYDENVLSLGNNNKVGINNVFPEHELDVNGTGRLSGKLIVQSSTNSVSPNSGAAIIHGGLGVIQDVNIRGSIKVYENTTIDSLLPLKPTSSIGTNSHKFDNVYANAFHGTFYGHLAGSSAGGTTTASKLDNETAFSMLGDVKSDTILFDGETGGLVKKFTTSLNSNVIVTKPIVTELDNNDTFLIHSNYDDSYNPDSRLCQISKSNLIKDIISNTSIIPIATVTLFAGDNPPPRWLICDGSEINTSDYPLLYSAISGTYTPPGEGTLGKFHLPHLVDTSTNMIYIIYAGT